MATTMSKRKVYAIFDNGTMRERQSYMLIAEDCTIGDAVDSFNLHHAQDLWKVQHVQLVGIVANRDRLNREADVAWAPTSIQLGDMLATDDYLVFRSTRPEESAVDAASVADVAVVATASDDAEAPQPGEEVSEDDRPRVPVLNRRFRRTSHRVGAHEARRLQDNLSPPVSQGRRERKKTSSLFFLQPVDTKAQGDSPRLSKEVRGLQDLRERKQTSHFDPSRQSGVSKTKRTNKQAASRTDTNATSNQQNESTSRETSLSLRDQLTKAYKSPMSVYKFCNTNHLPRTSFYRHMDRSGLNEMKKPFDNEVAKKIDDYVKALEAKKGGRKDSNILAGTKLTQRKPQSSTANWNSTSEGSRREELEGPPRKKARTQSTGGGQVRHSASEQYEAGSRHFYRLSDGVEYPVIVQSQPGAPSSKLKANERRITFEGYKYSRKHPPKATTAQLFPVTPEREKAFQEAKKTTRDQMLEERSRKWLKEERRRRQKRAEREATRRAQRRQKNKDRAMRREHETKKFGDRTTYWGPFPECEEPGSLILQDTRRVYFAKNDETPSAIAEQFGVPVGKVVYDNLLNYGSMKENTPLKPLTLIVLPLEETVNSGNGDIGCGKNSESDELLCPAL
jgi:hypothetical protein